jgi:hypothetical protein
VEGDKENDRKEIFSERVRAGKRTYFFDVKATRSNDYYLTITESKRRYVDDGYTYEKHKIFLYKEDFNKFMKALNTTVDHVKEELLPEVDFDKFDREREENYKAKMEESNTESGTEPTVKLESESKEETASEVAAETINNSESESDVVPDTESEETSAVENELKWD